ncbi:hypothetical protein [Mesorhizobium temperatum]|uniref:Uncharacterized protein n=1 Tax=Mesorhizobium temperatum TaxID=241416 RepID=A0A271LL83_9HYPH|nr:hypothetical protein [Mesorhizobium temperatum]PAQ08902.1 hypothetical protein CIT26_14955 [Mesorhizobium temperatum]
MSISGVPKDDLPDSETERHAALRDYFCDIDGDATLSHAGWDIALHWPGGPDRHVDPRLTEGLVWWGDGVTLPTMVHARRRRGRILSALYDTWTLHSWSEWIRRERVSRDERLVVLHVDDHRDLGSPRLFESDGTWIDSITRNPCRLDQPDTVLAAIESGAIGMGSFMTPFLHGFPGTEVRQLCQPPKAGPTKDFVIELTSIRDTLIDRRRVRPAISLSENTDGGSCGRYRLTTSPTDWLDELGDQRILLHIDMDYFNNRYDGDTDWQHRAVPLDPPNDQLLAKIDEVTDALAHAVRADQLVDIVVAYSPGFFPAEFWATATQRLIPRLERIYER